MTDLAHTEPAATPAPIPTATWRKPEDMLTPTQALDLAETAAEEAGGMLRMSRELSEEASKLRRRWRESDIDHDPGTLVLDQAMAKEQAAREFQDESMAYSALSSAWSNYVLAHVRIVTGR
jgi:hypothetical protein